MVSGAFPAVCPRLRTSGTMSTAFHREPPTNGRQTPAPYKEERRTGKGEGIVSVGWLCEKARVFLVRSFSLLLNAMLPGRGGGASRERLVETGGALQGGEAHSFPWLDFRLEQQTD